MPKRAGVPDPTGKPRSSAATKKPPKRTASTGSASQNRTELLSSGSSASSSSERPSPQGLQLAADFVDLLSALSDAGARFLVIGGYAVGVHGHPRATKDLDLWIDPTATNARRVMAALVRFGAPLHGLTEQDLVDPDVVFQIGVSPTRVDILSSIKGVRFPACWKRRTPFWFGGVRAPVIALKDLVRNKRLTGRLQDLADAEALSAIEKASNR